jgi:IS605 OrfB family transposase
MSSNINSIVKNENYKNKQNNIKLQYQQKISQCCNMLWLPSDDVQFDSSATNSCYDFNFYTTDYSNDINFDHLNLEFDIIKIPKKKVKIIDMYPTLEQILILNYWFNAYIKMYNETIKFIKSVINFQNLIKLREIRPKFLPIHNQLNSLLKQNEKFKNQRNNLILIINQSDDECKSDSDSDSDSNNHSDKNEYNPTDIIIYHQNVQKLNDINKIIKENNITINKLENNNDLTTYNRSYHEIVKNLNYWKLRSKYLKQSRDDIITNSGFGNIDNNIKVHILDCAIKEGCKNYQACVTNYLEGNIEIFHVRYWNFDRRTKGLEIEKSFIKNGHICHNVFGEIIYKYNNENYKLNPCGAVFIYYNSEENKYRLLEPCDIKNNDKKENKNEENNDIKNIDEDEKYEHEHDMPEGHIGIDLGIRTFATCLTKNEVIKFGTDISNKIEVILLEIDDLNKKDKTSKITKYIRKLHRRITNMVDDMHWKLINYLTNTYEHILVGDLNMRDASNKRTSVLNDMTKRKGLLLAFSKFRNRLKFKCSIKRIKLSIVNEKYSSKICSMCGYCKENLGGAKKYNCDNCKIIMDRDVNACRGIIIKKIKV